MLGGLELFRQEIIEDLFFVAPGKIPPKRKLSSFCGYRLGRDVFLVFCFFYLVRVSCQFLRVEPDKQGQFCEELMVCHHLNLKMTRMDSSRSWPHHVPNIQRLDFWLLLTSKVVNQHTELEHTPTPLPTGFLKGFLSLAFPRGIAVAGVRYHG